MQGGGAVWGDAVGSRGAWATGDKWFSGNVSRNFGLRGSDKWGKEIRVKQNWGRLGTLIFFFFKKKHGFT